jgi:hypothetical protein
MVQLVEKYCRKCDSCNFGMNEGYVINGGEQYYCSKECLYTVYSPAEWDQLYETNDSYWTEWDVEYELINN